jgi:hypothetical protein
MGQNQIPVGFKAFNEKLYLSRAKQSFYSFLKTTNKCIEPAFNIVFKEKLLC